MNNITSKITSLTLSSLLLTSLLLSGCKKPESNFLLKQYEYSAGDMLLIENLSLNNKNSDWDIIASNGAILKSYQGKNPGIITGILYPDGTYYLRLTSSKGSQRRKSIDTKPFIIKCLRTELIINPFGYGDHNNYSVYIDNQLIGESEQNGYFSANIPVGYRLLKLVADNEILAESIIFEENQTEIIHF